MASLRKVRVIARKQKQKAVLKAQAQAKIRLDQEKKLRTKAFKAEIRTALGFDKIKIKGTKTINELIW